MLLCPISALHLHSTSGVLLSPDRVFLCLSGRAWPLADSLPSFQRGEASGKCQKADIRRSRVCRCQLSAQEATGRVVLGLVAPATGCRTMVRNCRGADDSSLYAAHAKFLKKEDQPNDTRIFDRRRRYSGSWSASRFGFSRVDLVVSGMVQRPSLQEGGARPAAGVHEPVHGRVSLGRTQTESTHAWSWQRLNCRRRKLTHFLQCVRSRRQLPDCRCPLGAERRRGAA